REHGIVANGWAFHDLREVGFWKQANALVPGEQPYQSAKQRDARHTTAKMFWGYNMYADVDWSMTPRPCYAADGLKVFDSYSPPAALRAKLHQQLGMFPLPKFWGPAADIDSTRWIVDATLEVMRA